jgi:hypothetical protein
MELVHPASLSRVTVHRTAPIRRAAIAVVFVVLYAAAGLFVYDTIGVPRRLALEAAERAEDERFNALEHSASNSAHVVDERADVDEEEVEVSVDQDGNATVAVDADATLEDDDNDGSKRRVVRRKTASVAESIESLAREEASDWFSPSYLPSEHQPDTWAMAALFLVLTLHALFHLVCRWLTWFKAMWLFQPSQYIGACPTFVSCAFFLPASCCRFPACRAGLCCVH